jgi:Fe2+ transport system protein B
MITLVASRAIVIVGKESVGKTQLLASLSGRHGRAQNFRGSTVAVEHFSWGAWDLIDTPGIHRQSDSDTTRRAIEELAQHKTTIVVAQATHLDDDLRDLLSLVDGKRGFVVVTFWDKVARTESADEALNRLAGEVGVPFVKVDARHLTPRDRDRIEAAIESDSVFTRPHLTCPVGWRIEPTPGILERRSWGPVAALILLLLPVILTVWGTNVLAGWLDPLVHRWTDPVVVWLDPRLPELVAVPLTRRFGLLTMGPFLFVWAAPTVVLYAVILGAYKASGLIERLNVALEPLLRPFGLAGRDLVRILIGMGCNVPAVISTRACSSCSRGTAISAIAFGAACSYQLPATMAVFSGIGQPWLVWPFLAYLTLTTLIYLRLTAPAVAKSPLNLLVVRNRTFMEWPEPATLWREAASTLRQFFRQALPVFFVICVIASYLAHWGVVDRAAAMLAPLMGIFNLPLEAAIPVVMASIRKDGIFLFLAEGSSEAGLAAPMTSIQVLTGVYLAGVLLPCLVTAWTIRSEQGWRFATRLLLRQAAFAVGFTLVLAWGGWLIAQ